MQKIEVQDDRIGQVVEVTSPDGKLLSFAAMNPTKDEAGHIAVAIYNNPQQQDEPSACVKVTPQQMAEVFQQVTQEQFLNALVIAPLD